MFAIMVGMLAVGLVLLVTAPWIARAVLGRRSDTTGLTRILQVIGAVLLIVALVLRPHNPRTAAFPPPPDSPLEQKR